MSDAKQADNGNEAKVPLFTGTVPTNAAGRLLAVLKQASDYDSGSTVDAWRQALGIEDRADQQGLLFQYTQLLVLYHEAIQQLENIEGLNRNLYLSWTHPVGRVLDISRHHQPWANVKSALTGEVMQALKFADDCLAKLPAEKAIEPDELNSIHASVQQLLEDVVASDLDKDIKTLLAQQLNNVCSALLAYRLRGATAIKDALEKSFGAVVLNVDVFRTQHSPIVSRFKKLLVDLHEYAAKALTLTRLTESVTKLLT